MTQLHHNFKARQWLFGFRNCTKRTALEHVLIPETYTTHKQRLTEAGFRARICGFNVLISPPCWPLNRAYCSGALNN